MKKASLIYEERAHKCIQGPFRGETIIINDPVCAINQDWSRCDLRSYTMKEAEKLLKEYKITHVLQEYETTELTLTKYCKRFYFPLAQGKLHRKYNKGLKGFIYSIKKKKFIQKVPVGINLQAGFKNQIVNHG